MSTQVDWVSQVQNKPQAEPRQYQFNRVGAQNLVAGSPATMRVANPSLLVAFPDGITAASPNTHWLRITDSISGNEAVLLTAVDVTAGTVTFTPGLNHTAGNWQIMSASGGLQEAANANPTAPVYAPAGTYDIYAKVTFPSTSAGLYGAGGANGGSGFGATSLVVRFTAGDVLYSLNANQIRFTNFTIIGALPMTSGSMIFLDADGGIGGFRYIDHVNVVNAWDGFTFTGVVNISQLTIYYYHEGIRVGGFLHSKILPGGLFASDINTINLAENAGASVAGSAGIHIVAQTGGAISNTFLGGFSQYGLWLDPNSIPYPVNEGIVEGLFIDGFTQVGLFCSNNVSPGYSISHWSFASLEVNASAGTAAASIALQKSVQNMTFSSPRVGFYTGTAGFIISGARWVTITGGNVYPVGNGGVAIHIDNTAGAHDITVTGVNAGKGVETGTAADFAFLNQSADADRLTVTGNNLQAATQAGVVSLVGSETNVIVANNNGLTNANISVASAAALAFPMLDNGQTVEVTGNTGVTSVSGLRKGQTGYLKTLSAVAFTAGATIGNSLNTPAGGLTAFWFDGTHIWLK